MKAVFESNPHQVGCPWEPLSHYGLPNIDWCESTLCAWVAEPANTWSNSGYLMVAIVLYLLLRKERTYDPVLRTLPGAVAVVGLASGIYHASVTWVLLMFDFLGMYVFIFLMFASQLFRLGNLQSKYFIQLYIASVLTAVGITGVLSKLGLQIQMIILVCVFLIPMIELRVVQKMRRLGYRFSLRWFGLTYVGILGGAVFLWLDGSRKWCNPDAHGWFEQGHALWHWLTAIGMGFSFLYYRDIDRDRKRVEA